MPLTNCSHCDGEGLIECPECNGEGCDACGGEAVECEECDGTGQVELANDPELEEDDEGKPI